MITVGTVIDDGRGAWRQHWARAFDLYVGRMRVLGGLTACELRADRKNSGFMMRNDGLS